MPTLSFEAPWIVTLAAAINTARGLAIIVIVIFHSELIAMSYMPGSNPFGFVIGTAAYLPVPTFVFFSGLAIAGAVRSARSSEAAATRLTVYIHLYLLWSVAETASTYFLGPETTVSDALVKAAHQLAWPRNHLWFLYALALYLFTATLLASVPRLPQLAVAVMISISSPLLGLKSPFDWIALMFPLFVVGVNYTEEIFRHLTRDTGKIFISSFCLFIGLRLVSKITGLQEFPGLSLFLSATGVLSLVTFSLLLARLSAVKWLRTVGNQSLPIYLLHAIALGAVWKIGMDLGLARLDGMFRYATPIFLAVAAVAASLAFHRATSSMLWLYSAPKWTFNHVTPTIEKLLNGVRSWRR